MTPEILSLPSPNLSALVAPTDSSYLIALAAAEAATDRKGEDIVILAVGEISFIAEYFVIVSGFSRAQLRAIDHAIQDKLFIDFQRYPRNLNERKESNWILQDYGDLLVHIMSPHERAYYGLEAFWGHAPRVTVAKSA